MKTPAVRFSSHIRFVTRPEWQSLQHGALKNAYYAASCPGWEAEDFDQFVLQPKTFTDSIGTCISGGLTGNLQRNTTAIPMRAGIFHLIPRANLMPLAQLTIEQRLKANRDQLVYPLGGLVCGGQDYDTSRMLASTMISWLTWQLKRKPSYFLQQDSNSCTRIGYDGKGDTWYINCETIETGALDTADDVKKLFKKRYVSPEDTVYLGLHSTVPLDKGALDSD